MKLFQEDKRNVCVVLVDRANYGRLKPVMSAIQSHPQLNLQVVVSGTMLLERFGQPVNVVREDGFPVDGQLYIELEGSNPVTMAKSVGFGLVEFASELGRLSPDVVLLVGDRYEAVAAAIAAAYMNLCLIHVQGGEVSGSIDESARHAITKFSHFHFPSTQRAAEYIVRMGERPETILGIGCPSSDIARGLDRQFPAELVNGQGSGRIIQPGEQFLLAVFHPTTTEYGVESEEMLQLLRALHRLDTPTVMLWPNIDAGSDHVSRVIRRFRDQNDVGWLRTITNLPPEEYLKVLSTASCAVGNSSSFVRDASFLGTPVVLIGHRQAGRETAEHLVHVEPLEDAIAEAIETQLSHGQYAPSTLYGDGNVSERIANAMATLTPYVQKRLYYPEDADQAVQELREKYQPAAEAANY